MTESKQPLGLTDKDWEKIREFARDPSPHTLGEVKHGGNGQGDCEELGAERCAEFRRTFDGETVRAFADAMGRARSTVRKHIRGDCSCVHDEPPWDYRGDGEWVRLGGDGE